MEKPKGGRLSKFRGTPEAAAFWNHVERTAKRVDRWPAWKRGVMGIAATDKHEQIAQSYEERDLARLVELFGLQQMGKLREKLAAGYEGWSEAENAAAMHNRLQRHVDKGFEDPDNLIDIANMAMFLWNLQIGVVKSSGY